MAKRAFDIFASAIGLIVLSPLLLIVAIAIKVSSAGPVFYRANRIGWHGEPFQLFKFRSMVVDADQRGPGITTRGDARITVVGRVLRKTKLDELPQLLNVLRGEMSIVGPRPEDTRYVALYTPEQRQILAVRPGITSLASIKFRHEEQLLSGHDWERHYIEEIMPAKLAIDLNYVGKASLGQDLGIIFRTLMRLFERD